MCEVYWYMVILLLVLIGQKAMVMIKLVTHRKSIQTTSYTNRISSANNDLSGKKEVMLNFIIL